MVLKHYGSARFYLLQPKYPEEYVAEGMTRQATAPSHVMHYSLSSYPAALSSAAHRYCWKLGEDVGLIVCYEERTT